MSDDGLDDGYGVRTLRRRETGEPRARISSRCASASSVHLLDSNSSQVVCLLSP